VIRTSTRIIEGIDINNPAVIRALTADGSSIAEWGKYSTQSFASPGGPFKVHFYYNPRTGIANYSIDYKAVFNAGIITFE
jgi:hypothetical protein